MSGSKGLQRYVPRILQDSGMIASSEVAHYTHLKLVQYVKADDIDAALRRAKAEGVASVRRIIQNRLIDLRLARSTCRLSFAIDEYDAQIEALESIMRQAGEPFSRHNENGIDARAAQIEEGE